MPKNVTKRTAQGSRANNTARKKRQPVRRGRKAGRGNGEGCGGLFTLTFKPKAAVDIYQALETSELRNIADPLGETKRMYDDLSRAYRKYCRVMGVAEIPISLAEGEEMRMSKRIRVMYEHVAKMAKAEHKDAYVDVNHDTAADKYYFLISSCYKYGNDVYTFPMQYLWMLEETGSKMYKYMLQFCGWWLNRVGFGTWKSNSYAGYGCESLMEKAEEVADDDPKLALEMIANAQIYAIRGGMAEAYLKKMWSAGKEPDRGFMTGLGRMNLDQRERFYRRWIQDGVLLMREDGVKQVSEFQYAGEFDSDDLEYGTPVAVDDCFVICWNSTDHMMGELLDYMNMTFQEGGSYTPMETLRIDDKVRTPYKHNGWADKLRVWMMRGLHLMDHDLEQYLKTINDNEAHERADEENNG